MRVDRSCDRAMSFPAEKAVYGCFFLLIALVCPSATSAEISLEPRVGFRGLFQLGHPFPLEVELSNSDRAVEGNLEVRVWKGGAAKGGSPYPFFYRKEVFLPAQSRKSVQLTVDPDFVSRPMLISFVGSGGKVTRELDLRRHFSPAPLMLLLSESNTRPAIPLGSTASNRLVSISLAELPGDPRALLGVSTLFLYEQSLRELSRSQALALETWLAAGGRLVILSSLNTALYQEANINRFMPVRVTGLKKISSLGGDANAAGLEHATRVSNFWAQEAKRVTGRVLIEAEGSPLVVEAARGKGTIIYLALDIGRAPLANWNGLPALFKSVFAPRGASGSPAYRASWDEAIFFRLFQNRAFISTYVPTGSFLAALGGYFAAFCFFSWLWQRSTLPKRTLAAGAATVIVLAALVGYLFFSRGGNIPDGVLLASTLLDNLSEGYVEAQSHVALFSTQQRRFDLQVERGWIDLAPIPSRSKVREDPAIVSVADGSSHRFLFPLREWDYRLLRLRFIEPFPLHVAIENQSDRIFVKLNNQAAKDLVDCWLVVSGQRFFLGEIAHGSSWTKEFPIKRNGAAESGRSDTLDLREISFKDKTRELLFHSSFFPRDARAGNLANHALFFGWVKDPNRRVWVEDSRIWAYDYALFRVMVPLAAEDDA
jgi:hypothetical protein